MYHIGFKIYVVVDNGNRVVTKQIFWKKLMQLGDIIIEMKMRQTVLFIF